MTRLYQEDIRDCCTRVAGWCAGADQAALMADDMRRDAVLRNLELTGEAARHVDDATRERFSEVPWRSIADSAMSSRNWLSPEIDVRRVLPGLLKPPYHKEHDGKGIP